MKREKNNIRDKTKKKGKKNKVRATVMLKPLSANEMYLGRKRKAAKYRKYERELLQLLPDDFKIPRKGKLKIHIIFGFSSSRSDLDNGIKPFLDCLQTKYSFNDNRVYYAIIEKKVVKKGEEYIYFCIKSLE